MKFIAVLDYDHLDNGVFLTAVARALSELQNGESDQAIIVHGESEYTERLIQTGIMREEAEVRAIKDLNHRLIALFADQGVSAVGLNGYQREGILLEEDDTLSINMEYFDQLHRGPVLVLSNLVLDASTNKPSPVPLPRYIDFLEAQFSPDEVFLFSKFDHKSPEKSNEDHDPADLIPTDLSGLSIAPRVVTAAKFKNAVEALE